MKKLLIIASSFLLITGCATKDYSLYAEGQSKVNIAKYNAEAARYKAMSDIAASGNDTAKVAAVIAMAIGQGGGNGGNNTQLQAPSTNEALQWASILVPGITQAAGIYYNAQVQQTISNNAASVSNSTNSAFVGIASKIQAAPTITTTTTTDRHDVVSPAPVVITPVVINPPVVVPPIVVNTTGTVAVGP